MKKIRYLLSVILLAPFAGKAQIVPDNSMTPLQLVQNYIVGPGITVSGVTFNGTPGTVITPQMGFFSGSNSTGLDSGVIITNGHVMNVTGPNNAPNTSTAYGTTSFDPDLNAISTAGVYDVGSLEFDFIPTGDTVKFSYVFGSEEYMEYVFSGVNDAFGIFLSGPGITGPYSMGAQNIATLPGGIPISIDNVNLYSNPTYYIDNPIGVNPFQIEYDGYTVKLTAKWAVTCGLSYHIKFAIGDGGDETYDSGVFIEAGSFTSTGTSVAAVVPPVMGAGTNGVFEGCVLGSSVDLVFTRPNTSSGDTLFFNIGGNAINGVDYSTISPSYVVFAPGQDSVILTVNAINDGIPEGIDTLDITLVVPGGSCGGSTGATVSVYIYDPYTLMPFGGDDTAYVCPGQSVVFNGIVLNGNPPFSYGWSDGTTGAYVNYTVTQIGADTLVFSVTDGCGYFGSDTVFLEQVAPSAPLTANAGPDVNYTCYGDTSLVVGSASGGTAPYTYIWEGISLGPNYTYTASPDTVVVLTVTDFCGSIDSDTLYAIHVPAAPIVPGAGPDQTVTCVGQTITLAGSYTGGTGNEMYSWSNGDTTAAINVQPLVTTQYILTVYNNCLQSASDTVTVIVPPYTPITSFVSDPTITVTCPGTPVTVTGYATGGGTAPYSYQWSNMDNDSITTIVVTGEDSLILTITDACGLDVEIIIPVEVTGGSTIELDFPDGRYCRNSDSTALVPLTLTGGAAPYTFTWLAQPGGTIVTVDSVDLVLTAYTPAEGFYNLTVTDACGASDSDTGYIDMASCNLDLPNVITPNGDGINDVLEFPGLSIHPNSILRVYNRWGTQVYYDANYMNNWNGGSLAAGIYFYVLELTDGTIPAQYTSYVHIFY